MRSIRLLLFFVSGMAAATAVYSQQWGLYTLYATKNSTQVFLIDTNNATYKTWSFASNRKSAYSAYLIPNDTLVRSYAYTAPGGISGGGMTGGVQKVAWDGSIVWDFQYNSSSYGLHHDICPMPNGNVLMIAYEVKSSSDAIQAGASSASQGIWSEKIMEVKPTGATTGTVVWEWRLWDHLCQNYNSSKDNYVTSILNNPQLMNINYGSGRDRFHMNGIDYNAVLDQIVVSMHFMNEIYVIDHSTTTAEAADHTGGNSGRGGDFLYRWGNPAAYGASGTTNFNVVHDAHWVPSDNPDYPGYFCAYNNKGGAGNQTAVDVWNPPYSGNSYSYTSGSAYGPSMYSYRYTGSFSAQSEGNSQQLPNGNMIVNNPMGAIYEINENGTIIWSKTGANSTHAYRYSLCYVRGPAATASASSQNIVPGTQITLNGSAVSPSENNPVYTYSWTSVPAGFTSNDQNPVLMPSSTTTYILTVTNTSIGCYDTDSVIVNVGAAGIDVQEQQKNLVIYPNPTTGMVHVNTEKFNAGNYRVIIRDVPGKTVADEFNKDIFNLSDNPKGIYFITLITDKAEIFNNKIILIK